MKPISPKDVVNKKREALPEKVLEAFNELIARNWDDYSSVVLQKEVANLIASKLDITTSEVYSNHYLDVEDIYRKAGWIVEYDKPAYCETYEASFTFTKPRTR